MIAIWWDFTSLLGLMFDDDCDDDYLWCMDVITWQCKLCVNDGNHEDGIYYIMV